MASDESVIRVVVVTGAASGIGRAAATRMRRDGWAVVAADVDDDALSWVDGGDDGLLSCVADVTTETGNAAMVHMAIETFGRLDAAVLNAGIAMAGPLDSLPIEALDRVLAVNLRGVVLGVRAVIPALRDAGGGAIVVTGSTSGLGGDPDLWPYNAAKGGVVNFARAAAIDLGGDRIRVNAVCPGPIAGTAMTTPLEDHAPALYEEMRSHVALGRFGQPAEVASVIAFLCSNDASFVTGVALPVDGGVTAGTGMFRPSRETDI
jgi:meso-butanediol dehydrogenase / (S,S)-butanediol dehydrogenase / diacetyl reductase